MIQGISAVVYKELRHARRDPATLVLALMIPVVQLMIFGLAIDTEIRDIPTVVVDRAGVRASRDFQAALEATGTFRIDARVASRDEALVLLRGGQVRVAVLFPRDLAALLQSGDPAPVQFLIDGSDSNVARQAQAAATGVAQALSRREAGVALRLKYDPRPRFLFNPDGRSEDFFVPGLAGIILQLVTIVLTAFAIVRERERGTLEQLLVTPISPLGLTLGKILPSVILGGVATGLVLAAMVFLFDVPIRGSGLVLFAVTTLFLFTSLALGLFISTIAQNQLQALMMTLLVLLPSVLLSGFIFPRQSMPPVIYELTWLIPATYFVEILRGVVLRGAGLSELGHLILPLSALGGGLLLLSTLRLRRVLR